jgi:polyribonucleotide nucleotidyltransferase
MSHVYEIEVGGKTISLQTGLLAPQADGAVVVRSGGTVLLVTAQMGPQREGLDFLPLTVDFEERLYAAGRIPGSFFRREGRPTTDAILSSRLTDRTLRPRFPKSLRNELQIISTVLSADQITPPEILGIVGASAALSISRIPFDGPIAATVVGFSDGKFLVNPTYEEMANSELELVVAGSRDAVIMVEAGANELSEEKMLEALNIGQEQNVRIIELQDVMIKEIGIPKIEMETIANDVEALSLSLTNLVKKNLESIIDRGEGRGEQSKSIKDLQDLAVSQLGEEYGNSSVAKEFDRLMAKVVRSKIIDEGKRPDGRKPDDIRPLSSDVSILPRTHGSALFQRGETQVLSIVTLAALTLVQKLDGLKPENTKRYMHHYNFAPFSTGEVRRVGSPGRREIGHGALAERALSAVIPNEAEFPYALRVVSEVLSSNGSTSMASVCGSTLALMDAGVPIRHPVSGIAMGLMSDDKGNYAILSDIQGVEDFMGDMDFKVAGTENGITALQMDIKISGITMEIMENALEKARIGRTSILSHMLQTMDKPRSELSTYAPRIIQLQVPVDKIGAVIGPGGKTIRGIIEQTGVTIDVADDGTVTIGSNDADAANLAIKTIENLTKAIEVGEIYTGKVVRLMDFGAFVEILPGKDGLVHVSELADYRVPSVEDVVKIGEELSVMVTEVDRMGRVNLSRRAVLAGETLEEARGRATERRGPGGPPRRDQDRGGSRGRDRG